ncbi:MULTISPECIES: DUF6360 family protein [Natrinema]|uniref:Uncharacterized protein n=2 Tax=Natrinema TaxID=88723 RepID=M0C512_9EURY|nr:MULTISPECIES: DUF6360 family protein [Natrinema]ELZ17412.1 hypothetical protein C476_15710 [Natrinema limicola JCM 13563]
MADRLMKVNAYTTLDLVDAVVTGHDFETESLAVVNATANRDDPDCVRLQFELDNMTEAHLPAHMEALELTPEQARTLAADLEKHAARVEEAHDTQSAADRSDA